MVSSINPSTTGASALGVEQRFVRGQNAAATQARGEQPARFDNVELGGAASWAVAGESVRNGLSEVQTVLALGAQAQALLVNVMQMAREGATQEQLDSALGAFAERVQSAIDNGAVLASGGALSIQAEPGAEPITIAGADLRLKQEPQAGDLIQIGANAQVSDPELLKAAQSSLDALQKAMEDLLDAARSLEAHQGFLGVASGAISGATDMDAESARLLALQIRQGLEAAGGASIANAEPQAVLSLFRT